MSTQTKQQPTDATNNPGGAVEDIKRQFVHHIHYTQGKHWEGATPYDQFVSIALTVRDYIMDRSLATQNEYAGRDAKRLYYLSMEYLLGQLLRNNLVNLGLFDAADQALGQLGVSLEALCVYEPDAGLGNGGLGRLAACFLDSLATIEMPAYGYGIRYEYGMFEQAIRDGWQVERPDNWLRYSTPWEVVRPEFTVPVRLYGRVIEDLDGRGGVRHRWIDYQTIMGLPHDLHIVGYNTHTVNLLRLWAARCSASLDLEVFNRGGYVDAVHDKVMSETISKVLYPDDSSEMGRKLRLVQQYFFVSCTLQDVMRRFDRKHDDLSLFPEKVAIQLNDTHPSVGVAELMRIFVDERGLPWDKAWDLTNRTIGYTNHTLLPEALEVWPLDMFSQVLPRHIQIIYEINRRFLDEVVEIRWPGDTARREHLSIIQESPFKAVRMANLAIVGSHAVNGVAKLHTELLTHSLVPDFAELWPDKFQNKTNGVTPRRWLLMCNPDLAKAITQRIGDTWGKDLLELKKLEQFADDPAFQGQLHTAKHDDKNRLAHWIRSKMGITVSPDAIFDVHCKRLHEYKRQLMNIIQVVMRYHRIIDNPKEDVVPRVILFGAKAAPAYHNAKLIIKLINDIATTINKDPRVGDKLKVAFLPNYRVSLAELIVPAADLSEQISTAGLEASGTGNMKFAMNGALTIGTLDGANIEIRDAVGADNFFLFGLTAEEVSSRRFKYNPWHHYEGNPAIKRALDSIAGGEFNREQPFLFAPVRDWLTRDGDYYMVLADLPSYVDAQAQVDALWLDHASWMRKVILNIARVGYFSSDRTIREYAADIWNLKAVNVPMVCKA